MVKLEVIADDDGQVVAWEHLSAGDKKGIVDGGVLYADESGYRVFYVTPTNDGYIRLGCVKKPTMDMLKEVIDDADV